MDPSEVRRLLELAVQELLRRDLALFDLDANERTLTHRLAMHLAALFPGWDVDCEYNRDGHAPKTLRFAGTDAAPVDDEHATTVFPDIIVHRRGLPENLLVLEAKKTTNPRGAGLDHQKLHAFAEQLGYKVVVFAQFETRPSRERSATLDFHDGAPVIVRI